MIHTRKKITDKIHALENTLKDRFPNQSPDLKKATDTPYEKGDYYQKRFTQWMEEAEKRAVKWECLQREGMHSKFHATMTRLPDQSVLASGDKPNRDIYTLEFI